MVYCMSRIVAKMPTNQKCCEKHESITSGIRVCAGLKLLESSLKTSTTNHLSPLIISTSNASMIALHFAKMFISKNHRDQSPSISTSTLPKTNTAPQKWCLESLFSGRKKSVSVLDCWIITHSQQWDVHRFSETFPTIHPKLRSFHSLETRAKLRVSELALAMTNAAARRMSMFSSEFTILGGFLNCRGPL